MIHVPEMPKVSNNPERSFSFFALALLILAAIIGSLVNFPPGDSWTHGWTVLRWLQGDFVFNHWSSTLALPQQLLGWIINFGNSEINWAALSILSAAVTIAACLLASRLPVKVYPEIPQLLSWAPLLTILFIASPYTLKIALGFMTDGYYLFFMTVSLWFLLSALSVSEQTTTSRNRRWIGFASFAALAGLQRTHGLVLFIIAGLWLFFIKILPSLRKGLPEISNKRGDKSSNSSWFPFLLCVFGLILTLTIISSPECRLARAHEVQSEFRLFWTGQMMSYTSIIKNRIELIFGILHHLGLALLPITLIARLDRIAAERKGEIKVISWFYVISGTIFLLLTAGFWEKGELFPYLENSITAEGFGPRSDTIALTAGHTLNYYYRILLTIFGTIGGMLIIWFIGRSMKFKAINWSAPSSLMMLIGLAHLGLILLNPNFFDRYLVPLVPFVFCWIAPFLKNIPRKARTVSWIMTLILLGWSSWGNADAILWSKAKWDLASELRHKGIPSSEVLAGYEPDGFYNFTNENYISNQGNRIINDKRLWWVRKLNLPIHPRYVMIEKGAATTGTPFESYEKTEFENSRMEVLQAPAH